LNVDSPHPDPRPRRTAAAGAPQHVSFRRFVGCGLLQRHYWLLRLVDVLLFCATATMGYLNMLVVMTYNPGLMMAIVIGEGLGALLLDPIGGSLSAEDNAGGSCH
jgi:hypothetical protein